MSETIDLAEQLLRDIDAVSRFFDRSDIKTQVLMHPTDIDRLKDSDAEFLLYGHFVFPSDQVTPGRPIPIAVLPEAS